MTNVKFAMEYAAKIDRAAMEKRLHYPVATKNEKGITLHVGWDDLPDGTQIYTSTHQRDWVGLTGTEINHIFAANAEYPERMIQAAEALLKEKNGG